MTERPDRRPPPLDPGAARTVPLEDRPSLVEVDAFASLCSPADPTGRFVESLPDIHAGRALRRLRDAILEARRRDRPVVFGMGAHVLKVGCSPVVIDLLERGLLTAVALNGAGIVHDYEIAAVGRSSEDVGRGLTDGSFGMAEETGRALNEAAREAAERGIGLGQAVGERILAEDLPYSRHSVLACCARLGLPATVHVAIGTDIVHMHPAADGAAIGQASLTDFHLLGGVVARLSGGVYCNVGSAVVLPEVFVKALNLARNLGHSVEGFLTANLDQIRHYRPRVNVLDRPGGERVEIVGHHELLLPLLRVALLGRLEEEG